LPISEYLVSIADVFTVLPFHVPAKITGDEPVTIHLQAAIDNGNEDEELLTPWH
jgi:hypothetical protein